MRREGGFATSTVFAVLLLLAAALSGLAALVPAAAARVLRSRESQAERERLERAAKMLLEALADDPTPKTDSPLDPAWSLAASGVDGVSLELRDVSSRVNPNYVRKKLLEETDLESLLAPGVTARELQQYRESAGLSASLAHYGGFFSRGSERLLTCYGWANVNTTDEFVLRSLARSLTGSEAKAQALHGKIQGLLAGHRVISEGDLPAFLGAEAGALEPCVCAAPSWNLHFLDPFLLTALLSYPPWNIEEPERKAKALLAAISAGDPAEADIAVILGIPEGHVLLHYVGLRTWFWELRAWTDRASLTLIAARDPRTDRPGGADRPRFIVIERRHSP